MGTNSPNDKRCVNVIDLDNLSPADMERFKPWLDQLESRRKDAKSRLIAQYRFRSAEVPSKDPHSSAAPALVVLPPGHRLAEVARFLLTRDGFKRYVAPVIADMQEEYIEAIAAGHEGHALWIAIRGHLLVFPNWLYALIVGKLAALLRRGS
jgi:hypothetical protein